MDLANLRKVFDEMVKMNKKWALRIQEETDSAMEAIQQALVKLQSVNNGEGDSPNHHLMSILIWLRSNLIDRAPRGLLGISAKLTDLHGRNSLAYQFLIQYLKEKNISHTWRDVEWDTDIVNRIIASHLYREGLFDVGDCFVGEAHVLPVASAAFRSQSVGLHRMLDAMRSGDLGPALNWAESQHEQLLQKGSCLEMELNGRRCLEDAQKLAEVLSQQYFDLMGQPARSPLRVVVAAGALALMGEELTDDLVFHSCIVCPMLSRICTELNPAMMLPCGHILCYMTLVKMLVWTSIESDGGVPYLTCGYSCRGGAVTKVDECQQIYF